MVGGDKAPPDGLKLFFYQRVFLRAAMRYKYVYAVFPRAYSKSFLAVLILMIRCILYPGAKLFVTSGGKEQASSIMKEKVTEICQLVPAFASEIDWRRGKTTEGKDYVPSEQKIQHLEALLLMLKALTGDDRYEELFPALQEVTENAGGISKNCQKSFPASQLWLT